MKVILLQDVPGIGKKYDIKNVSNGYARNFLIPRKLAQIATTQSIQSIEKQKKQKEQEKEVQKDILGKNIETLENLTISVTEKASEKGHLFAGIDKEKISKILKEQKQIDIPVDIIELEKPIKEIGEYKIKVKDKEFLLVVSSQ